MTKRNNPAWPPGWYPDPAGQPLLRWWDGARWGEQTQAAAPGAMPGSSPQAQLGDEAFLGPPAPRAGGRRTALGVVAVGVAAVLVHAGLALALRAGPSPQPASPLVVQGRVSGTDGKPVSGIKVWLNAWPSAATVQRLTKSHQPVWVTVVGSITTSPAGTYTMRVSPSSALAANATDGVVKFQIVTGNSTGLDTSSFSRHLGQTTAGNGLTLTPGGAVTADLRLMPNKAPKAADR